MNKNKTKILVNAVPLLSIGTGISRYIKNLYLAMEAKYSSQMNLSYFDGVKLTNTLPDGPDNIKKWSSTADLFFKMPPYVAFNIHKILHYKREHAFKKIINGFDIYHESGFFPFKTSQNVNTIFTIHDMSYERLPQFHPQERVLFIKHFLPKVIYQSNKIITVSKFSQNEIIDCFDISSTQITTTLLAPDPVFLQAVSLKEIRKVLRQYNIPKNYFIFVGSNDPRKNCKIIPRALVQSKLPIPLVHVGWSGWSDFDSMEKVISLGYIPDKDLAALYSGATALVYPSFYEGFGLPIVEAMACGCPVITTRQASLPEVAGDAALYLEMPNDIGELSNLMCRITDPAIREKFVQLGYRNVSRFSWEFVADKTWEVFQQAVEQP